MIQFVIDVITTFLGLYSKTKLKNKVAQEIDLIIQQIYIIFVFVFYELIY